MRRLAITLCVLAAWIVVNASVAQACVGLDCDDPVVTTGQGALTAAYLEQGPGGSGVASNSPPPNHPYTYRLSHPCVVDDRENGGCRASDFRECPAPPDRVVEDLVPEQRRLALPGPDVDGDGNPDGGTVTTDGFPTDGAPVGTPVGPWIVGARGCIDITALNPPPSPAEVFRYFQTLPLPELVTQHQPPGDGLTGLPVIFYTDSPTTQTFTVDIRGFQVVIQATAEQFTWHTGDPTGQIVTTDPGQPYPDQTIEHDYRTGTYTAHLTVTWGATFTVNGSTAADVPGTTTTDGPPVTFDVRQARTVLTNPYD
ncbi:hypothetical protein [Blastococcus xanthinilyticus]|uniref:PKD domain-containing protein n=1 Tax=Blastococcus xanthinilyticus TaxID=1564164 RepID=A0A5S5D7W4_9ACTN|nr:hypothetical protein [Blastococcus xanthinilyticus]TYP90832.1 hypothetical protein BD833_101551 [Blastococcus xanthinilyticus]